MKKNLNFLPPLVLSLLACACTDNTDGSNTESTTTAALGAVDPSLFAEGALVGEVAGDPRPIPGFNNFCRECRLEDIGGGIRKTVLIPTTPVPAAKAAAVRGLWRSC